LLKTDPRYVQIEQKFKDSVFGPNKDQNAMMVLRSEKMQMERAVGYKAWKMFLPFAQLPIVIGAVRLMRDMATLPVPSLETGGLLWFQDLTLADPFFVLPIVTAYLYYASMRVCAPPLLFTTSASLLF